MKSNKLCQHCQEEYIDIPEWMLRRLPKSCNKCVDKRVWIKRIPRCEIAGCYRKRFSGTICEHHYWNVIEHDLVFSTDIQKKQGDKILEQMIQTSKPFEVR